MNLGTWKFGIIHDNNVGDIEIILSSWEIYDE